MNIGKMYSCGGAPQMNTRDGARDKMVEMRKAQLEAALASLREHAKTANYVVSIGENVEIPGAFADTIPDEFPDGYRLFVIRVDNYKNRPLHWGWAAVRCEEFTLLYGYPSGQLGISTPCASYPAGTNPVVYRTTDTNCDTSVRLPEGSLTFVEGTWVPCECADGDWWEGIDDEDE